MKDINLYINETPKGILTLRSKKLGKVRVVPMESMTQNYWRIIANCMQGNLSDVLVRSDGTETGLTNGSSEDHRLNIGAEAGEEFGVVVGSGTNVVGLSDTGLQEVIRHGAISGFLNYLETIAGIESGSEVTLIRLFENLSGAPIEVNEVGIFAVRGIDSDSEDAPYMLARDLLDESFVIPDTDVMTVTTGLTVFTGTRNVKAILRGFVETGGYIDFYHRDGTVTSQSPFHINCLGGEASDLNGILLGRGDTPIEQDDIDLDDRIVNGGSAGQLVYGETTFNAPVISGNTITWSFTRGIINASDEDIEVKEAGIFSYLNPKTSLLYRLVLPNPVLVEAGSNRNVNLNFRYQIL